MLRIKKRGQTSLEYLVMLTIVLAAFLAVGNYIKRGLQGRWKTVSDEMGDQYDPRSANSALMHTVESYTDTAIVTMPSVDGFWTSRLDLTNSEERKTGYVSAGAY
jgi:uncharacterized protein (UPF0333 family)